MITDIHKTIWFEAVYLIFTRYGQLVENYNLLFCYTIYYTSITVAYFSVNKIYIRNVKSNGA